MQVKILPLIVLFVIGVSLATSCDKNAQDPLAGKLQDPIQIALRSSEKEMVKSDQSFCLFVF